MGVAGGAARYCVLDVETALSDTAVALASAGERPAIARVALHELVAASLVMVDRGEAGRFGGLRHVRLGEVGEDEETMLRSLGRELGAAYDDGAVLVTFNGRHDLSVLRRRAARHWLFGRLDFPDWSTSGSRHLDLMRLDLAAEGDRWPNLIDAAAGFGIGAICPRATASSATVSRQVRKAEVDTAATLLLLFHHLAGCEGNVGAVVEGWAAMSRWLISERDREDHLRQFSRHPFARTARDLASSASD